MVDELDLVMFAIDCIVILELDIYMTFSGGCLCAAWQGIKNMAAVNKASAPRGSKVSLEGVADEALPNHMNSFFTRFKT